MDAVVPPDVRGKRRWGAQVPESVTPLPADHPQNKFKNQIFTDVPRAVGKRLRGGGRRNY